LYTGRTYDKQKNYEYYEANKAAEGVPLDTGVETSNVGSE
jgi:hypothetical protein